ncbi:MAG: signal peptidase I [Acidimicrobiales bacterium]
MHLPSSSAGEQPPPPLGEPPDPSDGGSIPSFVAVDQGLSVTRPRSFRSRRGRDYRLRGLDLSPPNQSQAPTRHAKKVRPRGRFRRRLLAKWIVVLMVATVAAVFLRASVLRPFSVPSASMMPTLQVGDRILVVKSGRLAGPIHGGDIVVFRHPGLFPCSTGQGQAGDLVQRVIALPGDTIWSAGNRIYVNGRQLQERGWYYSKYGQVGSTPILRTKIPPDQYFVMGDNRSNSCDSRAFGTIPRSTIVGKVFAIVMRAGHPYIHLF